MPENKSKTAPKPLSPLVACILLLFIVAAALFIYIGTLDSKRAADNEVPFQFTIGDTDSIPRCVTIKGPDETFVTVQADNEIEINPKNGMCVITEAVKNPDYFSYVVKSENVLIFQTASAETIGKMKNQYGPANITCATPDGKIIEGRAEKIYIHDNNMCEFILSNTWYCSNLVNMSIETN